MHAAIGAHMSGGGRAEQAAEAALFRVLLSAAQQKRVGASHRPTHLYDAAEMGYAVSASFEAQKAITS